MILYYLNYDFQLNSNKIFNFSNKIYKKNEKIKISNPSIL